MSFQSLSGQGVSFFPHPRPCKAAKPSKPVLFGGSGLKLETLEYPLIKEYTSNYSGNPKPEILSPKLMLLLPAFLLSSRQNPRTGGPPEAPDGPPPRMQGFRVF